MVASAGLGSVLAAACVQVEMTVFGYLWGVLEGSLMHRFQVICTAIETSGRQGAAPIFGCSILLARVWTLVAGCPHIKWL